MNTNHAQLGKNEAQKNVRADASTSSLRLQQDRVPVFAEPIEVATGIWWIRQPVPMAVNHVNIYLLEDELGLTLVDTGCYTPECRDALQIILHESPLSSRALHRVIVTHGHPDHVGLAGFLANRPDVQLLTSRTTWLSSHLLQADSLTSPCDAHIEFVRSAGLPELELAAFERRPPNTYRSLVAPLPARFQRLREGDIVPIGPRKWTVRMGYGHADEHLTLWSDDGIALVGDQILPSISPRVAVHFSEPGHDPLAEWLASCQLFSTIASNETLCLPGHNQPFTGAAARCQQLATNCQLVLDRILNHLTRPRRLVELMTTVYRRPLDQNERLAAVGEMTAYINYLFRRGAVTFGNASDKSALWSRTRSRLKPLDEASLL